MLLIWDDTFELEFESESGSIEGGSYLVLMVSTTFNLSKEMEWIIKSVDGTSGSEAEPKDSGDQGKEDDIQGADDSLFKKSCKLIKKITSFKGNKVNCIKTTHH